MRVVMAVDVVVDDVCLCTFVYVRKCVCVVYECVGSVVWCSL